MKEIDPLHLFSKKCRSEEDFKQTERNSVAQIVQPIIKFYIWKSLRLYGKHDQKKIWVIFQQKTVSMSWVAENVQFFENRFNFLDWDSS